MEQVEVRWSKRGSGGAGGGQVEQVGVRWSKWGWG